ncbi:hypothetical protein D3C81_634510 [compost metagenome]
MHVHQRVVGFRGRVGLHAGHIAHGHVAVIHARHAAVVHAGHAHVIHGHQGAWVQCRQRRYPSRLHRQGAACVASAIHRLGEQGVGRFGRFDDNVEGFRHGNAKLVDAHRFDVQAIGGDHGHFQAGDAHVEVGHGRAVDEAQPQLFPGAEHPGPVRIRRLAVQQVGVSGAADVRQVGGVHLHFGPHFAIGDGRPPAFFADVVDEVAHGAFVEVVVIGLFFQRLHQADRVFVGPVAEHHHVVAVVLERLRVLGVDHQRAVDAGLFLKPRMAVIPVGAVLAHGELVDVHAARLDALEAQPRHAVHVGRQQDAVPVNGGAVLESVAHPQRYRVAFTPAQQWAGDAAVDGHRGAWAAAEVDRGFADEQVEFITGQHLRFAGTADCPGRRAP